MNFEEWWRSGEVAEFDENLGIDYMDDDDQEAVRKFSRALWDAAQPKWQPIETAPLGKAVLVLYKNSLGKDRIIKAKYIERYTEEDSERIIVCRFCDYYEETDEFYAPEGWYELVDNSDEYSRYRLDTSNKPTHWMPLPSLPTKEEQ